MADLRESSSSSCHDSCSTRTTGFSSIPRTEAILFKSADTLLRLTTHTSGTSLCCWNRIYWSVAIIAITVYTTMRTSCIIHIDCIWIIQQFSMCLFVLHAKVIVLCTCCLLLTRISHTLLFPSTGSGLLVEWLAMLLYRTSCLMCSLPATSTRLCSTC